MNQCHCTDALSFPWKLGKNFTPLNPGVVLLLLFPFTTSLVPAFWERPSKAKSSAAGGEEPRKTQLPLKEGVTGSQSTQPCCKPAKHWAPWAYEQLFAVKWQHLLVCLMLWLWSTLPEETSSVISNLTRYFIFPTASNSINRQLITSTVSPQDVRPHRSKLQALWAKKINYFSCTHFNILHPKHSRHFTTKCLTPPPPILKAEGIVNSERQKTVSKPLFV